MTIVTYDENFDRKVEAGATALLAHREVPAERLATERQAALQDARAVLLGAMTVPVRQARIRTLATRLPILGWVLRTHRCG